MDDGRIKCTSHWKCVTCMSHTPIHLMIHNNKPIATKVFRYLKTKKIVSKGKFRQRLKEGVF
jgi:hypothetical protein